MLIEYDRNSAHEAKMVVQNLITQCARLYDALIKNFDMVLKVKDQCAGQSSEGANSTAVDDSNSPSNSIYS